MENIQIMEPLKAIRWLARNCRSTVLLLVCALMALARTAAASSPLNPACPPNFFTNVASRLLSSQLNVNLNHIQIYPTNEYTPAVHRLLQVTANILDATTTNYYTSVFRPLFWKTNEECGGVWQTNIYVTGYQYVQEPLLSNNPPMLNIPMDANDPRVPFGLSGVTNNIYGIPWVIGVKKGLPNFNALEAVNSFSIQRSLQMQKQTVDPSTMYATNQMYIMMITNYFGAIDWNSYAETYTNPVAIVANVCISLGMTWTNGAGIPLANNPGQGSSFVNTIFASTNIILSTWPALSSEMMFGTNVYSFTFSIPGASMPQANSFQTAEMNSSDPTFLNFVNSSAFVYYYGPNPVSFTSSSGPSTFYPPCFIPSSLDPSNYLDSGTPPLPQMTLLITNRIQAYMIDSTGHVLDYVQLGGINNSLNLNQAVADNSIIQAGSGKGYTTGLWSTNFYQGEIPFGVNAQYLTSLGAENPVYPPYGVPAEDLDGGRWNSSPITGVSGRTYTDPAAQQAFFTAFVSPTHLANYYPGGNPNNLPPDVITNYLTSMPLPFTPTRKIVQRIVYEANDPLVHYMASDLYNLPDSTNGFTMDNPPLRKLVGQNDRYMPWGMPGNFAGSTFNSIPVDNNAYNVSYKDPLVVDSDAWNFPTNQTLNPSWLGQVHRGTPWQTIYLKSPNILDETAVFGGDPTLNIGFPTWQLWTGDLNPADAAAMAPVQDWRLVALLASLFNTNNVSWLFSANDPNPADWENLLNGMTALTNDVNDFLLGFDPMAQFATLTISSNSSQAAEIANAIESTRVALPGQLFASPGEIFAVPQLSAQSPYLNVDPVQIQAGLSDLAYEAIPDQLLPLLRIDSIGSMTAANGQIVIQFTGDDNHAYAVQVSTNLVNWTTVSTNCPVNGVFTFTNSVSANAEFYRTVLFY